MNKISLTIINREIYEKSENFQNDIRKYYHCFIGISLMCFVSVEMDKFEVEFKCFQCIFFSCNGINFLYVALFPRKFNLFHMFINIYIYHCCGFL